MAGTSKTRQVFETSDVNRKSHHAEPHPRLKGCLVCRPENSGQLVWSPTCWQSWCEGAVEPPLCAAMLDIVTNRWHVGWCLGYGVGNSLGAQKSRCKTLPKHYQNITRHYKTLQHGYEGIPYVALQKTIKFRVFGVQTITKTLPKHYKPKTATSAYVFASNMVRALIFCAMSYENLCIRTHFQSKSRQINDLTCVNLNLGAETLSCTC